MIIMKASAGSGKTFNLSKHYIDLLLNAKAYDRNPYRHILAVTFTNKATAEMKGRILKDLKALADEGNAKARKILVDMLHDYSAFSVSTIDSFFQLALKSFSREIGQFADYKVELDEEHIAEEAMDRVLESLTEDDKELLDWITASVAEMEAMGVKTGMDASLHEIGKSLKSDEYQALVERLNVDESKEFSRDRISEIRNWCNAVVNNFLDKLEGYGVPVDRTEFLKKGVKPINKKRIEGNPELVEFIEENYDAYCTAYTVRQHLFSLGLAGEFRKEYDSILKERNLLGIKDTSLILRDIINGSDAPFVYEKLGVRYEHFLLDEFQDTSNIQWENFLPLLKESEAGGNGSLVVGDIKQSIYRFRNSDWKLLDQEVGKAFPNAQVRTLDCNWRSAREVVGFNNDFFTFLAARLGKSGIYSDVRQTPKSSEPQPGCVKVSFRANADEQKAALVESIWAAQARGARLGDIAVIVRGKTQGDKVVSALIDAKIPFISDDSLRIESSATVRRLLALLRRFENPDDDVSRYIADAPGLEYPENYHSLVEFCEDLLRRLRECSGEVDEAKDTLFIQAFFDEVQTWASSNGNNLRLFLEYWDEKDRLIGSPETSSAVKIITIHKSKGLEFPYVIFPFAESVDLYKDGKHWCSLSSEKVPEKVRGVYYVSLGSKEKDSYFSDSEDEEQDMQVVDNLNIFYVALTRAEKSLHIISAMPSKDFRDSLKPSKSGKPKKVIEPSKITDLLYTYKFGKVGDADDYIVGEEYDLTLMERKDSTQENDFAISFPSIPLAGRLAPSSEEMDFFGDDGLVGVEASARLRGVVLHRILSSIVTASDLDSAVTAELSSGSLDAASARKARELLSARIASHPEWFPAGDTLPEGVEVFNETGIFGADGREYRPDRVVAVGSEVTVVDFKFGQPKDSYRRQVENYVALYRALGRKVKCGVIWYVEDDKCVIV